MDNQDVLLNRIDQLKEYVEFLDNIKNMITGALRQILISMEPVAGFYIQRLNV